MPWIKKMHTISGKISKARLFKSVAAYLVFFTLGILSACTVGPDFVRPKPTDSNRYIQEPLVASVAEGQEQSFTLGATIPSDWWRLFKSAQLDTIVAQAINNNPSLQASEASLRQSQDNLHAGYGVFYPQVNVGVDAYRTRNTSIQQGLSRPSSIFNVVTASGTISYIFDIFGGERRTVEGLKAQSDYQNYMNKAAHVTLSANVVNTCIARAAYAAQIKSTEQLILLENQQLHASQAQFDAGTVDYASNLSIRSLIASNQASLAPLRQRLSQAEHLLATLEGVEPSKVFLPDVELTEISLPLNLPLSLPSDLVRQRPDILAAESQLHVASANIGVATAAMFPSFSLSATYGAAGNSFSNLGGLAGRFWSVGPAATVPLFRGGSLKYSRQATIDAYQQSQANYRQIVLSAFAQVADNLNALKNDADALQAQSEARRTAKEALDILQASYQSGLVAYVDVLIADVQFHQTTIAYLQAIAQRHQDTVGLFVALGGGWWAGQYATDNGPTP